MSEIGKKLVDLCSKGDHLGAIESLYAEDIVSVEPPCPEMPEEGRVVSGLEGVKKKNREWMEAHEVHGSVVSGPYPHDDRFAVIFDIDVTPKSGPMAGQRLQMKEVGLYKVKGDRIAREEFFYSMG